MEQRNRPAKPFDPDDVTRAFVRNAVLPSWTLAGLLDWYWHRRTKIECNAGAHESLTHLMMAVEGGIGALTGLFLEMNAGAIDIVAAAALAHEATVIWDVNYAMSRRRIHQYEQHTHSFMEVSPFANLAVMMLLHPKQSGALVGLSSEQPRFALRLRTGAVPARNVAVVLACGLVGVVPHVEEFVRCLRVRPTLSPAPSDPRKRCQAGN